jgi:hypothetical protein
MKIYIHIPTEIETPFIHALVLHFINSAVTVRLESNTTINENSISELEALHTSQGKENNPWKY